jgi:hypothetical protein
LIARTVASFCKSGEKLQKIRGKIENVGAPTFLGKGYPPVFADVGERKGLWTGRVYGGETLDLRRKWKIEIGKWGGRRNAFNAEEGEEGEAERGGIGEDGSGFG